MSDPNQTPGNTCPLGWYPSPHPPCCKCRQRLPCWRESVKAICSRATPERRRVGIPKTYSLGNGPTPMTAQSSVNDSMYEDGGLGDGLSPTRAPETGLGRGGAAGTEEDQRRGGGG